MFDIEKNSEIYFYGYSQFDLVRDKYSTVLSEGYNVKGYIDKKAYEVRKIVPCWLMEEFIYKNKGNENIVIIFLLQNALQHEEVARSFVAEGYKKILFIPANIESEERKKMYGIYNAFLEGEYGKLCNIPDGDEVLKERTLNRVLARTGEKWLIYFVPTELLFSYNGGQMYSDENIRFCLPYRELYDFLSGKCETCSHYFEFMKKKDNSEFIKDRKNLFLSFEYERNMGMDFFVEAAAYVKWNDGGYFNIIDGHHRAAYLAYKGYLQIPVRMEKGDFKKWENEEVSKLRCFSKLPCPIPLPGFVDRACSFEPRWKLVTDFFFLTLSAQRKKKVYFLEADNNFGYYSRFFQRSNRYKSLIVMMNAEDVKVCKTLNHLLRQNIEICEMPENLGIEIQAAYVDLDFLNEECLEKLLNFQTLVCLVVEVTERNEKQCLNKIQDKMKNQAEYICHYQQKEMKKIYGIARGETK